MTVDLKINKSSSLVMGNSLVWSTFLWHIWNICYLNMHYDYFKYVIRQYDRSLYDKGQLSCGEETTQNSKYEFDKIDSVSA